MAARTTLMNRLLCSIGACLVVVGCTSSGSTLPDANSTAETASRVQIAATNLEDTVVVDCQLPGKLQKLGGQQTYLTPGRLVRDTTLNCRMRGGEYTLGDLSGGTLSLKRWLPVAENGDAEAQYYVARIYANGMSGVPVDYAQAAHWYELAAKQGYNPAMQELGYLYEKGLGVPVDLQLALNLQRKASGLGADLDYAWKITAAQESAAKQVEELSARLEASNRDLEATRTELMAKQDTLSRSRAEYRRQADLVLNLKTSLEAARQGGSGEDAAHVKDLEGKLAARQGELQQAQQKIGELSADLSAQQAQLAASLAKSQATSLALNELTSARKADNTSSEAKVDDLRAKLAQTEDRLIRSQQELSDSRRQYQHEVQQLVEQRDEYQRAASKATDGGAALLAAKQRELDRQQMQIQSLEAALSAAKQDATKASGATAARTQQSDARVAQSDARAAQSDARAAQSDARATQSDARAAQVAAVNSALSQQLADMRARYDQSAKELATQRQQLAAAQTGSSSQRDALVEQMKQQMRQQLAARDTQLAATQRHLESLEYETSQLKTNLRSMEEEGNAHKLALDREHQQALDLQDELDKARTDAARERRELVDAQTQLDQQRSLGQQNAQVIARLNADVKEKEAIIKAKDERIATLSQQTLMAMRTAPPRSTPVTTVARVADTASVPDTSSFMQLARAFDAQHPGRSYALLIGNSNYRYMSVLKTPQNDVRELGQVLEQQYGFMVMTREDATARDIMISLDSYVNSLTENDRLVIYFAGHGDRDDSSAERAYWLGIDANPKTQDGYVEVENIQAKIKQMKAQHILLVADSCFSGAIAHGTSATIGRGINESRLKHELSHRARMVLTSGGNTPVVDVGGEADHSLFATYFIRTLRQNRTVMSGEMLAHEVYEQMKPETARLHISQAPTYAHLSDANHDFGDFFFTPRPVLVAAADLN